jgi:signal transduction histidine kinase
MLEPDSLGDLMRSLISFLGREMDAAKVVLEASIAEELPPVALDEGQIRQALLNLLRNAREAMPEGGTVHISATANKGGVSVLVQDEGSGVPQAERERIFDLFHTTKESGTGLGLALTREVVVAHGGTIECIDREGQGASFALWFPAAAK